jgi:transposase-like protein
MSSRKRRNNYSPEEKVGILKRHLAEKEPVSKICEELNIQPTVFYRWQQEFFENGAKAFQRKGDWRQKRNEEKIKALERKLQEKNEVLAELMEDHVRLKKSLGEV